MAQPFIGEIRMFGGNFAPMGYSFCNGALLSIAQNTALFSLIGTIYGGDGQTTFALPNLQSRIPIHSGQGPGLSNYVIGESAGTETVTLTVNQIPGHTHLASANSGNGTTDLPTNNFWAAQPALIQYAAGGSEDTNMAPSAIQPTGGSQPHENLQPYLTINFIIALEGIFPSRN